MLLTQTETIFGHTFFSLSIVSHCNLLEVSASPCRPQLQLLGGASSAADLLAGNWTVAAGRCCRKVDLLHAIHI